MLQGLRSKGIYAVAAMGLVVTMSMLPGTGEAQPGSSMDAMSLDMDPGSAPANVNPARESPDSLCMDALDNDGDTFVNDGCMTWMPGTGAAETGAQCANGSDDDADTRVNDGCTAMGWALGSLESCARINENNVVDADEDAVDAVRIEVTADNIPEAVPMLGFAFRLRYLDNATGLQVVSPSSNTPLLDANDGSSTVGANDPVPDAAADGQWSAGAFDTGVGAPEWGTGVLQEVSVATRPTTVTPSQYGLRLTDAVHIDPVSASWAPLVSNSAFIAVGMACAPPVAGDTDYDGWSDDAESGCGSSAATPALRPERIDGAFGGIDDDGDTQVDEALPPGASVYDCDGDGYAGTSESHVYGYNPQPAADQQVCGNYDASHPNPAVKPSLGWPTDLIGGGFSTNKVNVQDMASYIGPVRYMNTDVGTNAGDIRWDIRPGSTFGPEINVQDLTNMLLLKPPMLFGTKSFNGPSCPAAP